MPIYVIDPEAVLKFRRAHRRSVQIDRSRKRKRQAEKPKPYKPDDIDRAFMAAVDRDRS